MERFLYYVFRILAISRYSVRDSEDAPFVTPKEFITRACITGFRTASSVERLTRGASTRARSTSSRIAGVIFLFLFPLTSLQLAA